MKPDWKDAPEWAGWLTHDRDGWYWHASPPIWDEWSMAYEASGRTEEASEEPAQKGALVREPRP